ncbi:hypothetical protein DTO271G3_3305 [Paecilomyces variotii]|nr:hypothetical protein DTO271G3_3305 [Paecilomyces variotii]
MVSRRARKGISRGERDRKKQQNKNLAQLSAVQKKPPSKSKRDREKAIQQASKPTAGNPKEIHTTPCPSDIYNGITSTAVGKVFSLALQYKHMNPSIDVITRLSKTNLDGDIVSCLIEAALRLLPPPTTPEGIKKQQELSERKRKLAQKAENEFIDALRKKGYGFLTEKEQQKKGQKSGVTPDVRFKDPVNISGHDCSWLEYKNFFGFRQNPFIATKNKKQFRKYLSEMGPGAVVYKFGYETGHLDMDGVKAFRESDLLAQLQ